MKRYIEGVFRDQRTLFPVHLEDWIDDENVVRVIEAFVDELNLPGLGFELAKATGRPGYHPSMAGPATKKTALPINISPAPPS